MIAVAAFAGATLTVGVTSAGGDPAANVTICHRTDSVTNPYVTETVDEASVDGDSSNDKGQGDHLLEHTGPVFDSLNPPPPPHNGDQWGDIIPPFDENGDPRPNPSATLNWPGPGAVGAAIFFNGCNPVDFGSVVVTKVVSGEGATAGTLYAIHVACDFEGFDAGSADLSLADGASSASMTVVEGSTCTATEDTSALNANFVSTSNDGPATITAGTESTITVTNTFAVAPTPAPAAVAPAAVQTAPRTTG
jgi:hypothetical protein